MMPRTTEPTSDLAAENARLRAELSRLRGRRAARDAASARLKALLRRHWRLNLSDLTRTQAARVIAATWAAHDPSAGDAGTFATLHEAGVRPRRWRAVADLLDPALDEIADSKLQSA